MVAPLIACILLHGSKSTIVPQRYGLPKQSTGMVDNPVEKTDTGRDYERLLRNVNNCLNNRHIVNRLIHMIFFTYRSRLIKRVGCQYLFRSRHFSDIFAVNTSGKLLD